MFNVQKKKKKKCVCSYEGNDFAQISLVLNNSAVTIGTMNEDSLKVEKVLKMYACPKCKTLQVEGI